MVGTRDVEFSIAIEIEDQWINLRAAPGGFIFVVKEDLPDQHLGFGELLESDVDIVIVNIGSAEASIFLWHLGVDARHQLLPAPYSDRRSRPLRTLEFYRC